MFGLLTPWSKHLCIYGSYSQRAIPGSCSYYFDDKIGNKSAKPEESSRYYSSRTSNILNDTIDPGRAIKKINDIRTIRQGSKKGKRT